MNRILLLVVLLLSLEISKAQCSFSQSVSTTPATCNSGMDGSMVVTITGGVGPFQFALDGGPMISVGTFSGVSAGTHAVQVVDVGDSSCTTNNFYTVSSPSPIVPGGSVTGASCVSNCDGIISLSPSGGAGSPYTIVWSGGLPPVFAQDSLCVGAYSYTITDSIGCYNSYTNNINTVTLPVNAILTSNNVSSCGLCNGTASVVGSGGTGGYTFLWSTGASLTSVSGLCAGTYSVTLTDMAGCFDTETFIISSPAGLSVFPSSVTNPSCGNNDGAITLASSGTTGAVTYSIDGGVTYTSDSVFLNLYALSYSCFVQDALGCVGYANVNISASSIPGLTVIGSATNESAGGFYDGEITLGLTGGSGGYTFLWSNGATSQNISLLTAGGYTVTVYDTLANCNTYNYTVNVGPTYGNISGRVYDDLNGNCIYDAGDIDVTSIILAATPSGYVNCTNMSGEYNYYLLGGSTYTVSLLSPPWFYTLSSSCPVSPPVTVLGNATVSIDFPLTSVPVCDGGLNIFNSGIVPGFANYNYIYVYNDGTLPLNGTVKTTAPQYTTYTYLPGVSTSPLSVSGDTVTYDIINLLPGAWTVIYLRFYCPPTTTLLGLPSVSYGELTLTGCTDYNLLDNEYTYTRIITGSFDPNDKSVSPAGNVTLDEEYFTYLIRFQNTGNGPAVNIAVKDTLSPLLDYSQIELLGASHPYDFSLIDNSVMLFQFDNIMLPDSTSDEPGSHGWILFKIKRLGSVVLGDIIENTADIYFDFNEPVITNTTVTEFVTPDGYAETIIIDKDLYLFPNPTHDVLTIQMNGATDFNYTIFDMSGRKLLWGNSFSSATNVSVSGLAQGAYYVNIASGENNSKGIFIKK